MTGGASAEGLFGWSIGKAVLAGVGIFLVRFAPRWISSDMGNFSYKQPRQLGWCMGFVIRVGLGGEEAVEVVGTKRWLDGIFGKLGLIGG